MATRPSPACGCAIIPFSKRWSRLEACFGLKSGNLRSVQRYTRPGTTNMSSSVTIASQMAAEISLFRRLGAKVVSSAPRL